MSINPGKCYLISAGEFSGELLAAELVQSLRDAAPDLKPYGIVGETMIQAGVTPLAHISDLSVMGILEVARKIFEIRMIEKTILAWVDRYNPEFAVLVDFPGFHFRLAEQLHMRGIPVYQYVAPKVWAWGQKRVRLLRDHFTRVLGVLPFEEDFFVRHGVKYSYVGSPHYDRVSKLSVQSAELGFSPEQKIIAFLPGSRMSELRPILPIMDLIRAEINRIEPDTLCVIPLAAGLKWEQVAPILANRERTDSQKLIQTSETRWEYAGFVWIKGSSLELMKLSKSAVVASGTATLECALVGTPMVVVYMMNELSHWLIRRAIKIKWASLVNLLMNQEVVKEYIQRIDPKRVAQEVLELSRESEPRRKMVDHFEDLISRLTPGAAQNAAKIILEDRKHLGLGS